MKRLVDDPKPGTSPFAVDLLRSEAPYQPPPGRKERVRAELAKMSVHASLRRTPLMVRLAVTAVVLIGFGALARASLGHWPRWVVAAYERVMAPVAKPPRVEPRVHVRPAAVPAPDPIAVAPAPEPVVATAAPAPKPRTRQVARAAASGEDTTIVLEAMRALRLQGNPVRARALLARYLDRYPNGTLAEEALAMSIEAAVAHQDADAGTLAARYLSRYPNGPFHGLARQTLAKR
jgi:hypothetical protein